MSEILKRAKRPSFLTRINLDIVLALLGLLASAALGLYAALLLQRGIYVIFSGMLGTTCVIWLLLRNRITVGARSFRQSRNAVYALAALFFISLLVLVLLWNNRPEVYTRPLSYFVLTAAMAGLVSFQLLFLPRGRKYIALIIAQVLLLGMSVQFSQALIFPDVIGIDPALHSNLVRGIMANGHITPGADYSTTPLFHVWISIGSLLGDLTYHETTLLLVSLPEMIIPILVVYLIGRMIVNERVGLLSALLLSLAPYHTYFGVWAVANTLAGLSIPIIVYLLFLLRTEWASWPSPHLRGRRLAALGMIVLLMVALVLTHPVASMGLAVVLAILWSVSIAHGRLVVRRPSATVTLGTVLFFTTVMLGWWTYVGDHIYQLGEQLFSGFQISYLTAVPAAVSSFVYEIPLTEQLLRYLGMFLFFLVGIVGCFYMAHKRIRNRDRVSLALAGLIPCSIGFVALAFALSGLDARWFFLAEVIIAVPAATVILAIGAGVRFRALASFAVVAMVVSIAFVGIINPSGSIDNRDLFPNTGVRYAFIDSELQGAMFASQKATTPIASDFDYATDVSSSVFLNYYGVDYADLEPLDGELLNKTFVQDGSMKIIRSELADGPVRLFALPYRLDYDPEDQLDWSEFSKIYDNRGITAFI